MTLSEAHGALFLGVARPEPTPMSAIASPLAAIAPDMVALDATAPSDDQPFRSPVGLCRSEMQILRSPEAAEFVAYLSQVAVSKSREPPPQEVAARFEHSLDKVLDASSGRLLNYRLVDADLKEILTGSGGGLGFAERKSFATVRGPRWALASGFYAWQIKMVACVASRRISESPIDLLITVPSAFDIEEVRAVRALFDQVVNSRASLAGSVRLGAMIETPRLCAQAALLPTVADGFCFGLNDLTASTYSLDRDAWGTLADYYHIAGLHGENPFSILDNRAVVPLVERTIRELRDAGAKGPIFFCGEPANSPPSYALILRHPGTFITVGESDWASATVACTRERARVRRGPAIELHGGIERTHEFAARAASAARSGRTELAAEIALEWFS